MLTETFELPDVVPYPDDGNEATDHLLPSRQSVVSKL